MTGLRMSCYKIYRQFVERVGMITTDSRLQELGIHPCAPLAIFRRERLGELQQFCQQNPEYHIVSQLNANVLINRPAPAARLFFLAYGDQDKKVFYSTSALSPDLQIPEF
jgi:hypothetical protein